MDIRRSISDYSRSRDNNFQLIRVIAAVLVVYSHSFPVARGACIEPPGPYIKHSFGTLAVMIFFTISGYLVAQSWSSRQGPLRFLCARALRIYPALLASVLITIFLIGFPVSDLSLRAFLTQADVWLYVVKNGSLLQTQSHLSVAIFARNPYPVSFNDPLWTLHYEIMMYGLTLVFGLAGALHGKWRFFLSAFLVVAVGIAVYGVQSPWFQGALFLRLMPFYLAGTAAWVFRMYIPVSPWIFISFAVMAAAAYSSDFFYPFFYLALVYGVFVAAFIPAGRIRMYNRIGDYSYGIYIYTFPFQQLIAWVWPGVSAQGVFILAMIFTLPLACLSWHLIEKPALTLKP